MQRAHYRILILLGILFEVLALSTAAARALQASATVHRGQALTMLSDGRILATGGTDGSGHSLNDAYMIDSNGMATKLSTGLLVARTGHTATALPDGTVLVFGGKDSSGRYVRTMEIFDPKDEQFTAWTGMPLIPRYNHTATVLTDGRLVIIGGTTEGGIFPRDIQFWDCRSGRVEAFDVGPIVKRQGHTATLLSDGRVLLSGGRNTDGTQISQSEIFDPASHTFSLTPAGDQQPIDASTAFTLSGSIPVDGTTAFPIQETLVLRFSHLIDVRTATAQAVLLEDNNGNPVTTTMAAAENGRLLFVQPTSALAPGSDYILTIAGLTDSQGTRISDATVHFHTAGETSGVDDGWIPGAAALAGDWSSHTGNSPWQNLPSLRAHPGVTALAGQALGLSGKPLANITFRIEDQVAHSDGTGRFLLTGISPGHHVLVIDGTSANRASATYGLFEAGVDIKSNITNILNYTVWMTKLDTANVVTISFPTTQDTIITTPRIPGLELHLPANSSIVDLDGHPVTQLTITPIPLDKPPFPLPPGVKVPIYFTIQPGGSEITVESHGTGAKGAQLYYPNTYKERPGTRYNFWNYDAASKGWYVYGQGQVSADWQHIVPDPGVVIYELTGAMVGGAGAEPNFSPGPVTDGDPVDLSTGEFVYHKTDLVVQDTIPIFLSRTYLSNDHYVRPFGVGTTDNYDTFLVGDTYPYTYMDLILPSGSRVHFVNVSALGGGSTQYVGAIYYSTSSQGPWYGAQIRYVPDSWHLTTKDGTVYVFPDSEGQDDQIHQALLSVSDRYGNSVTLTRNSNAYITQITSTNGRYIQLQYDTSNRIAQATDNAGRTVKYTYDSGGHLWTVTDANGGITTFTYNSNDQMITIQDARGITYLTNQYDGKGRVLQQTLADQGTYLFNWTPSSNVSQTWISSGNDEERYSVDRYNTADYEGFTGLISQVAVTDPRGYVRQTTFNNLGMRITDVFALGQPEQQTYTYQYYADNLLNSTTDSLGRTTSLDYDGNGNLTRLTKLAGTSNPVTSNFAYGAANAPQYSAMLWSSDPLGNTTNFQYDTSGNLQSITEPLGDTQSFGYNSHGQMTSATDGMNNMTSFGYTGADLTSITDPLGHQTTLSRDQAGRLTGATDAQGHQTKYVLDNLNQITEVTDALGNSTQFAYDPNGNLQTLTDALNHATDYTYDNMDRIQTRKDPLQRSESYTYDLGGNIATFTDRKGQVSNYTFDGVGRLASVAFGVSGSTSQSNIAFAYDAGNRMTQATDSSFGTVTRGYDQLDHLTSESGPQGSISYSYDNLGRRITMKVTGQPQVVYAWDNGNRLGSISQGMNSVGFTYDNANRRSTLTLPNGIVANYSYDTASYLSGISYSLGGSPIGDLAYTYDSLGHRTGMTGSLATMNFPQTVTSATYDAANELTGWNGVPVSYDADGNLVNDGVHSYSWNARNQLTSIDSGGTATFAYDPFGRRVSKTLTGISATNFFYDGMNPVQELNNTTPSANLMESGIDEYFTRTDSTGTSNLLADALGSTVALTDANGSIQIQYSYDPFGGTATSGAVSSNSYEFTGREFDVAGLYYYRARYYSPATARFISEDPWGFGGGSPNLYQYVYDNPTDVIDPSGDCPWCIVAGIGAGFGAATEGFKGYECGDRGWKLAGDVGRGAVAGGVGALTGLFTGFSSGGNPYLGGAAGAGAYDATNLLLQPSSWGNVGLDQGLNTVGDISLGAATGGIADMVGPTVRGGWNWNPFRSARTFGPKAIQEYSRDAMSGAMGTGASMGNSLAGRKNGGC